MSDGQGALFLEVAGLLGIEAPGEDTAEHIRSFRFAEGLECFFRVCWRDPTKGKIVATSPKGWDSRFRQGGPSIGFSLNRAPESLARDIERRWLDDAWQWHRERVAQIAQIEKKETVERLRVEALLDANGAGKGYDAAKHSCYRDRGDVFVGHGIEFRAHDLSPDSYSGYRLKVEVQTDAAMRMIARIAGEDYRMHQKNGEDSPE